MHFGYPFLWRSREKSGIPKSRFFQQYLRSAVIQACKLLRCTPTAAIHAAVRRVRYREIVGCGLDVPSLWVSAKARIVRGAAILTVNFAALRTKDRFSRFTTANQDH